MDSMETTIDSHTGINVDNSAVDSIAAIGDCDEDDEDDVDDVDEDDGEDDDEEMGTSLNTTTSTNNKSLDVAILTDEQRATLEANRAVRGQTQPQQRAVASSDANRKRPQFTPKQRMDIYAFCVLELELQAQRANAKKQYMELQKRVKEVRKTEKSTRQTKSPRVSVEKDQQTNSTKSEPATSTSVQNQCTQTQPQAANQKKIVIHPDKQQIVIVVHGNQKASDCHIVPPTSNQKHIHNRISGTASEQEQEDAKKQLQEMSTQNTNKSSIKRTDDIQILTSGDQVNGEVTQEITIHDHEQQHIEVEINAQDQSQVSGSEKAQNSRRKQSQQQQELCDPSSYVCFSDFQKNQVLANGVLRDVQKRYVQYYPNSKPPSRTTIKHIWEKCVTLGTVQNRKHERKKSALPMAEVIEYMLINEPQLSLRQLAKKLNVSTGTISRRCKEFGYVPESVTLKHHQMALAKRKNHQKQVEKINKSRGNPALSNPLQQDSGSSQHPAAIAGTSSNSNVGVIANVPFVTVTSASSIADHSTQGHNQQQPHLLHQINSSHHHHIHLQQQQNQQLHHIHPQQQAQILHHHLHIPSHHQNNGQH